MFKFSNGVLRGEIVPRTRVNDAANALDVEELFDGQERFGFQAEIIKVVVPAGMFSEDTHIKRGLTPTSTDRVLKGINKAHTGSVWF